MKAEIRNRLLKALCEGLDPRLELELPQLDQKCALLFKQAQALIAVGDLLEDDPAGIVELVTEALEMVNAALMADGPPAA